MQTLLYLFITLVVIIFIVNCYTIEPFDLLFSTGGLMKIKRENNERWSAKLVNIDNTIQFLLIPSGRENDPVYWKYSQNISYKDHRDNLIHALIETNMFKVRCGLNKKIVTNSMDYLDWNNYPQRHVFN